MSISWQTLVACLRAELAEYGALLHMFEAQQQRLLARDATAVLELSQQIETQMEVIAASRAERERSVAAFATEHGQPARATLRALLAFVEADARPLVEALIDEVNRLLHRIRRLSRHNHTLLAHVVQVQQETLQHLRPQSFTQRYSPQGRVAIASSFGASTLQTAG